MLRNFKQYAKSSGKKYPSAPKKLIPQTRTTRSFASVASNWRWRRLSYTQRWNTTRSFRTYCGWQAMLLLRPARAEPIPHAYIGARNRLSRSRLCLAASDCNCIASRISDCRTRDVTASPVTPERDQNHGNEQRQKVDFSYRCKNKFQGIAPVYYTGTDSSKQLIREQHCARWTGEIISWKHIVQAYFLYTRIQRSYNMWHNSSNAVMQMINSRAKFAQQVIFMRTALHRCAYTFDTIFKTVFALEITTDWK